MRTVIDTTSDAVQRVAFTHGTDVRREGEQILTTFAGITYRADLQA